MNLLPFQFCGGEKNLSELAPTEFVNLSIRILRMEKLKEELLALRSYKDAMDKNFLQLQKECKRLQMEREMIEQQMKIKDTKLKKQSDDLSRYSKQLKDVQEKSTTSNSPLKESNGPTQYQNISKFQ